MQSNRTKRPAGKTRKNGKPSPASRKAAEDTVTLDRRPPTFIPQEVLDEFKGITFLPPVGKPNKMARGIIKAMREVLREEKKQ